jgi:methylase of polypeptide subunit release factors
MEKFKKLQFDPHYIWRVNDLDVYYTNETNGGGDFFAKEYVDIVNDWYGPVENALEWCSGPGFIGFALLASKLCSNISFNDMYQPAIDMLETTKVNSVYKKHINIFHGNTLNSLSSDNLFDLVVGNPPHWCDNESASKSLGFNVTQFPHVMDILVDNDWNAHNNFFRCIKKHLTTNGKILLQENLNGSTAKTFESMVVEAGLYINSYAHSELYKDKGIYYIEIGHQ